MKKFLLDTHTLIWFLEGDKNLSDTIRETIENTNTIKFVSVVCLWEIAIKISLGKLEIKGGYSDILNLIEENGFELLPLHFEDTRTVSILPFIHKDPFDRMIVAQAQNNNLTVLTKDQYIPTYDVRTLW
jgi:PIN domain nuclease of toxin-antitoxin system